MKPKNRPTPEQRERIMIHDAFNPWERLHHGLVDSQIADAINGEEWSNLPGKGKPLDLKQLALSPEARAQKLLKDAGFAPEWIELRQQIEALSADLEDMGRVATTAEDIMALQRRCQALNDIIRKHNRLVPSPLLERSLKDGQDYLKP